MSVIANSLPHQQSGKPTNPAIKKFELLIRAPRAIVGDGEGAYAIGITDGRVAVIGSLDMAASADQTMVLGSDVVLLPGLVDSHVHICEPGNTDWEGFSSATRAAAAGGITTLVDMPLDSLPTTVTVAALEIKRRAASGQCYVDVGFWGGAIPGNLADLEPLHEAGVLGFKCFLCDTGTEDFPGISPVHMEEVLRITGKLDALLIVHAEDAEAMAKIPGASGKNYLNFLRSRPRGIENLAIAQVIEAARATGARAHILHLSSSDALPMIQSARREGLRLSAESCPHYLTLCAEEIADGATAAKCGPPIREAANRELLWRGLADGILEMVVSDHSPCTVAMKELETGDFGAAWGGVSSLQVSLPVLWTEARKRGFSLANVVNWMATRPAQLAGLMRKGRIAIGLDADFCVFAPDERFTVIPAALHHRNPVTPYAGRTLTGVVHDTLLRGKAVKPDVPTGELLSRNAA